MGLINFYTRGGQLAVHKFRMFKQIGTVTALISFLIGLGIFIVLFFQQTTPYQRYLYKEFLYAEFLINMNFNDPTQATQEFHYGKGVTREIRSRDILHNSSLRSQVLTLERQAKQVFNQSLWFIGLSCILLMTFFAVRGHSKSQKKLERGNKCVSAKQLKKLISKKKQASDLMLETLPLLKDKETSHLLITGTTGSGKTNCLHTLLPQIRKRPNKAIIVDITGDFVAKYYREGKDLLLNPFDRRSQPWSPWADCLNDTHYDALASAIVPKSPAQDKFWENAGKALFAAALKEFSQQQNKSIQKLYYLLIQTNLNEFSRFFQNTDGAPYTHPEGEKMTLSIRATLANHLQGFKFLKDSKEPFSIRRWIAQDSREDQWLFLSARPDQRETLRPLMSGWLDTAINALMSLEPDQNRKVWFVIDELPALQKLPSLETIMAEGRKYGGCVLAGLQSFPQLTNTYGHNQAHAILDLFNTKIFFRNTDPNTTQWISKVLGETEVTEQIENVSYGANTMRDGVSLAPQTRTKPLILPTEISTLEDLEAYIRLSGDFPVAKIKMTYQTLPLLTQAFKVI
jgi:type IV conjugative transfer system coupling protein TraD